jgi:hypothetical protein
VWVNITVIWVNVLHNILPPSSRLVGSMSNHRFIICQSSFCTNANKVLSRKTAISNHAFQLSLTLKLSALLCTHTVQPKQISPERQDGTVTHAFHNPSQTLLITSRYFLTRICNHLLNCIKWDHFYLSAHHTHTHTHTLFQAQSRTFPNS